MRVAGLLHQLEADNGYRERLPRVRCTPAIRWVFPLDRPIINLIGPIAISKELPRGGADELYTGLHLERLTLAGLRRCLGKRITPEQEQQHDAGD